MRRRAAWALVAAAALLSSPAWAKKVVTGVANLNTATAAQLNALPGVGDTAVKRILEHRQKAPFGRIEELVKVKGFGKKKFEKLKAHLTVTGPTTIKVEGGVPKARRPPPKPQKK